MDVTFWGTRGSIASAGSATQRYGGNTAAVQVVGRDGTVLIFDAGTGIREITGALPPNLGRVDVFLSHLHMDHIQGLGFFAPMFTQSMDVHLWGPPSATLDLRRRLTRYLSPPLFPIHSTSWIALIASSFAGARASHVERRATRCKSSRTRLRFTRAWSKT